MLITGVVLLIASVIFGADLVVQNGDFDFSPDAFGQSLGNITAGGQFALGAITGFVIALAIGLILMGSRHRGRKALEHRRTRRELDRERAGRPVPATDTDRGVDEPIEHVHRESVHGGEAVYPDEPDPEETTGTRRMGLHRAKGR